MRNITILASGSGSNAENIVNYFKNTPDITINYILTNKKDAFVIERAKKLNIPCKVFDRNDFFETDNILNFLKDINTDFIVLAGFLWLVPVKIVKMFKGRIINIHPALLPKYGGKGMWGQHVHEAVVNNKENESGITIHYVNENYDEGDIIFQARCKIEPTDSANEVALKIHELEYIHFPKILEQVINSL